jgi:nucleotide-binding universal stress UspA family protein
VSEGGEASRTSVVVGVDGSEHSRRALQWAAAEARLRSVPLHVVHAFPFDVPRSAGPDPYVAVATQSLRDVAAQARQLDDRPLTVSAAVVDGLPSKVLVEESRRCALLVIGSRGHGGFSRLLLGSTAVDVTANAACPVTVIPTVPAGADVLSRPGDVVVGVDDSAGSEAALEFAFSRAAQRLARLTAVHVWHLPTAYGAYGSAELLRTDPDRVEAEASALLHRALAPWQERYPRVVVTGHVVRGQVVDALVEASRTQGEIVVVGARGRSVLAGTILGSVSQGLLHHAAGPVVIAR